MDGIAANRHVSLRGESEDGSPSRKGANFTVDDRTPRASEAGSPYISSLSPGRELAADGAPIGHEGEEVGTSEPPSVRIQRRASSDFYDTLPSLSRRPPSRSSTPKSRPLSPAVGDMPSSSQNPGPSNQSRQAGIRRQQVQQQQQQQPDRQIYNAQPPSQQPQQSFYHGPSPSSSESSFRTPSGAGTPSFSQPPAQQPRPAGYVGQYTMPTPTSSSVFASPHQHQPTYAYPPQLHITGMHSHGHSTPEFFSHRHSPVYTSPPFGPPTVHTSVQPEQSPVPALSYDYDNNQARSPTSSTPFTPPQTFPAYGFHPALTTTPQFSHSSYPSPYPPQQPQYRQSYTYMATSPSTSEDVAAAQVPVSWWYMPAPSASQSTGPYQNVYYVDAYGNRPSVGLGLGQGFPARALSHGPVRTSPFIAPDTGQGSAQGQYSAVEAGPATTSGTGSESEHLLRSPFVDAGPSSMASSSSRGPLSPSVPAQDESASERVAQPPSTIKSVSQSHGQRRPYHPPAHRSEWVMWVGNVPSDATHDELWRFFNRAVVTRQQLQPLPPALLPAGLLSPAGSSSASSTSPAGTPNGNGVSSIFLIARSNCAFVNYTSEANLLSAVAHFNGVQLRPGDPRCPRLVCRVRGKDEDQRAGVGGQRGMGMHVRWIKEQKEKEQVRDRERKGKEAEEPPQTPSSAGQAESLSSLAESLESNHSVPRHSSSSSTTSSFFTRYFPKRYFILKSLTQFDLDLSVERGLWATQPHNENILDKAFRTSSDVFLIFGVNKSGEFYGYARMEGPVGKTEEQVSWASRDSQHSRSPTTSFSSGAGRSISEAIPEEKEGESPDGKEEVKGRAPLMFSPSEHRLADDSPKPLTPHEQRRADTGKGKASDPSPLYQSGSGPERSRAENTRKVSLAQSHPPFLHMDHHMSAPSELGPRHRRITDPTTMEPVTSAGTADLVRPRQPAIELDREAPLRAVREQQRRGPNSDPPVVGEDQVKRRDTLQHKPRDQPPENAVVPVISGSVLERLKPKESASSRSLPLPNRPVEESISAAAPVDGPPHEGAPPQWGTPFRVRWMKAARLPFHRTRHLRNPWNHEREVKVSRDGTELEPGVGQALLDEWDKLDQPPAEAGPSAATAPSGPSTSPMASRRGGQFRRAQSQLQSQDQKS